MRDDTWLTADEAERERRFIAWSRRWAMPFAIGIGLALLAVLLWAVWTVSALLLT